MRYNDANAAISWLCTAFGFEKHLVVPGENNTVVHAQLTFGNGMIMLGSVRDGETADAPHGGTGSIGSCLIVNDADEVYARARAAGAKIIRDIEDQEYGGRAFSCTDLEGHVWHVGTYDPWGE
jgi:uncharacterized glyoxalase superfamily protein PhnB